MPKASKETASHVQDAGVMIGCFEELGEMTVGFQTFREDADSAPVMRGLPDDRCQAPHWGYVLEGRITFLYADGEETYETGDAYYAKPGHTTRIAAGTDIVDFAPTKEITETFEAISRNLAAAGV